MRKHLSVLALAARGTVWRVLAVTLLAAALSGALLWLIPAQEPDAVIVAPDGTETPQYELVDFCKLPGKTGAAIACAAGFAAMGAACTVRGRQLTLPGGAVLHGTDVTAPDLRGGAALLAAALAADGETRLRDPGHIPRGYEDLPGALRGLGAEIS